ncbi:hypothetical protein BN2537_8801 [Streptomyces venezuelae]|nr:hypothetical protein BN2537_8801 [Streptomyces venezuelae]
MTTDPRMPRMPAPHAGLRSEGHDSEKDGKVKNRHRRHRGGGIP